jgi:sn-glycerol 3-phosphate transport system permease protein
VCGDGLGGLRIAAVIWPALWLLLPSIIFLGLFTYWPVVQVTFASLMVGERLGLGNYVRLAADPHFATAALNNIFYAVGTIIPSLALALGFALALSESGRFTAFLRTILVFPLLIPLVAAAALFIFILLPGEGLLDRWLAPFGLGQTNWLGNPSLALGAIIGITIWKNVGYYMLFFLAGLQGIPADLHEAARLENASAMQRFCRITWPLLKPTLAFVVVIAAMNVLTQVDHIVVMTQGGPSDSTNVLLYYIYQQAEQNNDRGLAAAATVVSVAALLAISLVSLRSIERGIHYES